MFIESFWLEIFSETNLPVAVAMLQPIIAWPVAIVKFLHFSDFPMYGSPSGETGLKPESASAFSSEVIEILG